MKKFVVPLIIVLAMISGAHAQTALPADQKAAKIRQFCEDLLTTLKSVGSNPPVSRYFVDGKPYDGYKAALDGKYVREIDLAEKRNQSTDLMKFLEGVPQAQANPDNWGRKGPKFEIDSLRPNDADDGGVVTILVSPAETPPFMIRDGIRFVLTLEPDKLGYQNLRLVNATMIRI